MEITVEHGFHVVFFEVAGPLAQVQAIPSITDDGEMRYRFEKLWLDPSVRRDDAFAAEFYPALIAKVKELGWITDEDLANYSWNDAGIVCGPVTVILSQRVDDPATLRFRTEARAVAEESAAKVDVEVTAPVSADIVTIAELVDAGVSKEELKALSEQPADSIEVGPPPPSPSRPAQRPIEDTPDEVQS